MAITFGHPELQGLVNNFGRFLEFDPVLDYDRFFLDFDTILDFDLFWSFFRSVPEADIVLHFNPRLDQNKVIMNDRKDGNWGVEEMQPLIVMQSDSSAVRVFAPGQTTQILIECEAAHLKVWSLFTY